MAASENSDALAELASETVAPIEQELRQRLTVALGERDLLAVESALLKAFLGGMQAGMSETAESAIEQFAISDTMHAERGLVPGQLATPLPRLDPWAERYSA